MKILELPPSWRMRGIVITGITPRLEWFTGDELREAEAFHRERRRDEWMAARVAAKQLAILRGLCAEPQSCSVARPHLLIRGQAPRFVSVSHSDRFAAAAIDDQPVGIDVQAVREIPERASKFFLTTAEVKAMRTCTIPNRLLHFWCAKEAEWKRRGGQPSTLKQVPLALTGESANGLRFESVETIALEEDAIAALTRPTS